MNWAAEFPFVPATVVVPLVGAAIAFLAGPRWARVAGWLAVPLVVLSVCGLAWQVCRSGPRLYALAGWSAPLGIELRADGLALVMLAVTTVVVTATSVYGGAYFAAESAAAAHCKTAAFFWPLWLFLWGALNALFLSGDVFNLYITLELVTIAAVGMIGLADEPAALAAALRYLLAALLASLVYLLGVALLYGAYGSLDRAALGQVMGAGPLPQAAMALLTTALLLKTALFPLHFWLPAAHSSAPAPVSAVLSGLVVKASFYVLLRLWFEVFPPALASAAAPLLGALGGLAILWGSIQALVAPRLKLLVAYSTVAQLGYLFLVFPLAAADGNPRAAFAGSMLYVLAHGCAKASLFLAAGTVMLFAGHDRIDRLAGLGRRLPMTCFTMGLAGICLMGLPPSGAFAGKWLLLDAALAGRMWPAAVVIVVGGLLAACYLFRVLQGAFDTTGPELRPRPSRRLEWPALALALAALLLGPAARPVIEVVHIGAPPRAVADGGARP